MYGYIKQAVSQLIEMDGWKEWQLNDYDWSMLLYFDGTKSSIGQQCWGETTTFVKHGEVLCEHPVQANPNQMMFFAATKAKVTVLYISLFLKLMCFPPFYVKYQTKIICL